MTEILTKQQAADFLKISIPTLDRLRQTNKLKYRFVGNQVRFLYEDLEQYIMGSVSGGWQPQTRSQK